MKHGSCGGMCRHISFATVVLKLQFLCFGVFLKSSNFVQKLYHGDVITFKGIKNIKDIKNILTRWCSSHHYCRTSFNKVYSLLQDVRDLQWRESLAMAPAGNKV